MTNLITSGYNGWTSVNKDSGKCSAGGGIDSLTSSPPIGGISKDSASFLFSPHFYLHEQAAQLAYNASISFISQIQTTVDSDSFGELIGIRYQKTIVIVFDQSASMKT